MTTPLTYTRLASRAVFVVRFWSLVQPACLLEHGAHGKRSGRYLLFVEVFLCKSVQDLSVNLIDYVNDDGSILLSTVQTELIENQLTVKILKSVHTVSTTGMFPPMEGDDINLITTVFLLLKLTMFISRWLCSGRLIMSILCLRTRLSF